MFPQGAWISALFKRTDGPQTSFTKRSVFNIPDLRSDGEQQLLGEGNCRNLWVSDCEVSDKSLSGRKTRSHY